MWGRLTPNMDNMHFIDTFYYKNKRIRLGVKIPTLHRKQCQVRNQAP